MDIYTDKKYRNYSAKKIRKRSRAIPVPGEPIEEYRHERNLKCWYCGDINTTGRDAEDNGHSTMSSSYKFAKVRSLGARQRSAGPGSNADLAIKSLHRSIFTTRTAAVLGQNGTAKPVKNVYVVTSHRGCPSCGTINWSGKY